MAVIVVAVGPAGAAVGVAAANSGGSAAAWSTPTAVVAASPPVDAALPTISGSAQQGQILTATRGDWSGVQPASYAYQWQRCNASGVNCANTGSASSTYRLTRADVGSTIVVAVTGANSAGSGTAMSAATPVVQARSARPFSNTGPPVNIAPPTISGSAQQGQILTATRGSWSGVQSAGYAYTWQRCDISGANCANTGSDGATYTLTNADVGSTIAVAVTASNRAGSATARSAATMGVWTSRVVALWHMNEKSGTTMVDSAGHNNGSLHNITLGLPGFSGYAYGFNGSNSSVSVPSATSMNPGSANFSFTIHIKTTGTPPPLPADWDLIRKGDYVAGSGEYKMEFQHTRQASCGFEGTKTYAEIQAGPALNDGHWHTITCVKTSSQIEVIVDGHTYATNVIIGSISNTSPVTIGSHPGADWYNGSLDEANISIG